MNNYQPASLPRPIANNQQSIADLVCIDLQKRKQFGIQKYGTPLQAFNDRNSALDLYEELLDAACYCKQMIVEMDAMQQKINELQEKIDRYESD